jgi:heme/copper-type cytochrome/quinol oxidase subunit 1
MDNYGKRYILSFSNDTWYHYGVFINCCAKLVHLVFIDTTSNWLHVIWQDGFMNMISVVVLHIKRYNDFVSFCGWSSFIWLDDLSTHWCSSQAIPGSGMGMTLWFIIYGYICIISLMGSLNYIVTVINLRTKGMSMTRPFNNLGIFL